MNVNHIPLRWNFDEREDGIYCCKGDHEKYEPCDYQKLTPDDVREAYRRGGKYVSGIYEAEIMQLKAEKKEDL